MVDIITMDAQYYLNYCSKHLSRYNLSASPHWQFPIVDSHNTLQDHNIVSFVFKAPPTSNIGIIGTFSNLHTPIELKPIMYMGDASSYHAVSVSVPFGEVHRYLFIVDGVHQQDPINPQTLTLDNKNTWSIFFTHYCSTPISFEEWELRILNRLLDHMLPFRTEETENFLQRFYDGLDNGAKYASKEGVYRLDDSVGEVNFIDKLVAKEERHHLIDYKICLKEIDRLMRQRNPFVEPHKIPKAFFNGLYDEMASGQVSGWNYDAYNNPFYFLQILRRHAVLGAFSHPKYGGNSGGAGWAFLENRYRDNNDETQFDWRAALEAPLGHNNDYLG